MLEKAIDIAVEAHKGQIDKAGKHYILHPIRVMLAGATEEEMICGILHDVIEDTPVSLEMLREEGFSETVLSALALLTHDRSVPYMDYIHQLTKSPLAIQVKLHDLHDNLNRDRLGTLTLEDERRMEKYKKSQAYLLRFLEEHS